MALNACKETALGAPDRYDPVGIGADRGDEAGFAIPVGDTFLLEHFCSLCAFLRLGFIGGRGDLHRF